tara:strand:+ start:230 stop:625 length:396 start_codon:yes stop_codon:yes gene_type:complete
MLNLITIAIALFLIVLTGWTFTIYFIKKDSHNFLREELTNLLDICKKFFLSLKNLIAILASSSLSSEKKKVAHMEETVLKEAEQLLNLVQPIKEIKDQSIEVRNDEDEDDALSSFCPEVVEVINAEEEKVA